MRNNIINRNLSSGMSDRVNMILGNIPFDIRTENGKLLALTISKEKEFERGFYQLETDTDIVWEVVRSENGNIRDWIYEEKDGRKIITGHHSMYGSSSVKYSFEIV